MIISIRHGLVFVCVPKSASTSVESALQPHADIILGGTPALKHTTASEYQRFIRRLLDLKHPDAAMETVCVVREPLAWVHSWYRSRSRSELENPAHPFHRNYTGLLSFNQFVQELLAPAPQPCARIGSQAAFVCDPSGAILVRRIFPFDRLHLLALYLAEKIGQPIALPHHNASPVARLELDEDLLAAFQQAYADDYGLYTGACREHDPGKA